MALNRYEEALGELEIASRMDPSQNLYRARMQELVRLITSRSNSATGVNHATWDHWYYIPHVLACVAFRDQ